MERVFIFPGQGSQRLLMGKDLSISSARAGEIFERANAALGFSLTDIMWSDDENKLTQTAYAQPAILSISMAVFATIESEFGASMYNNLAFCAGHSLGEYSALVACKSLSFEDAVRLVHLRGKAMQESLGDKECSMLAVIGLSKMEVEEVVKDYGDETSNENYCVIANDNSPTQVVLSGYSKAIFEISPALKKLGAKRMIRLVTSAPFHCALMSEAGKAMEQALSGIEIRRPLVPIISNVTASPVEDPEMIRTLLVKQVTSMVRWTEAMAYLKAVGAKEVIEIGYGSVLTALTRKNNPDFIARSINSSEDWQI